MGLPRRRPPLLATLADLRRARSILDIAIAEAQATADGAVADAATAQAAADAAAADAATAQATADAAVSGVDATDTALSDHIAAADPHIGYQKESEKDIANGYLGADSNARLTSTKLQVSATDKLIGRSSSGAGASEEIACGAYGRALIGKSTVASMRALLGVARIWEDFAPLPTSGTHVWKTAGSGSIFQQGIGSKSWMLDGTTQGVVTISNGSASASTDAGCLYTTAQDLYLHDGSEFIFRVGVSNITSCLYRFGLRAEAPTNAYDDITNGVYFELASATSSNWYGCSAAAGSRSKNSTGYASAATTWAYFKLKFVDGSTGTTFSHWNSGTQAWVDDYTQASNIPTSGANRSVRMFASSVGAGATFREFYLDVFAVDPSPTGSLPIIL